MPPPLPPPAKKRKTTTDSGFGQAIQNLETQLIEAATANSSLNSLADLVGLLENIPDAHSASKAIYALYRVFVVIITTGKLTVSGSEDAKIVRTWIWDRLNSYVEFLVSLLKDEEKFLKVSAIQILFSLLKHLSTSSTTSSSPHQPQFHVSHFKKIVSGLLTCPPSKRVQSSNCEVNGKIDAHVRDTFVDTWFSVHDDIRWFFLREAASLLAIHSTGSNTSVPTNLLSILERLNTFPTDSSELNTWWVEELGVKPRKPKTMSDAEEKEEPPDSDESGSEEDWRTFFDEDVSKNDTLTAKQRVPSARLHKLTIHQSLHSLAAHRAVFTRTWLLLLPHFSISQDCTKNFSMRVLNVMHRGVLPHLTRPILVMDWIGACVDHGGAVGLLALNALFVLMKEYNLDYPSFYTRLYAFLDRDVLHLKHRARFFRMTELFLSSTHLPATLLASFVKRLSRLSLNAPPSAIIAIIPFTYNILKRHPTLMVMVHRLSDGDGSETDRFVANEPNPNITFALESSLWELYTHKNHYYSPVSTLARIFEESFTKPGYALEDFLDHTYGTLFETEVQHKIKNEPAIAMDLQKNLFPTRSDEPVMTDSIGELWFFG